MANNNSNKRTARGKQPNRSTVGRANPERQRTTLVNRIVAPRMQSRPCGMMVENHEYVSTLVGAGTGAVLAGLGLNPADPNVFPWLTGIARNYALYRWHYISVSFVSAQPTTTSGTVALGTFYDINDLANWVASGTFGDLLASSQNAIGPVYGHALEPRGPYNESDLVVRFDVGMAHKRTPWHLVSVANEAGTADDNQRVAVYIGSHLSPNNAANGAVMGTLHVSYKVEFINPVAPRQNPVTALGAASPAYMRWRVTPGNVPTFPGPSRVEQPRRDGDEVKDPKPQPRPEPDTPAA